MENQPSDVFVDISSSNKNDFITVIKSKSNANILRLVYDMKPYECIITNDLLTAYGFKTIEDFENIVSQCNKRKLTYLVEKENDYAILTIECRKNNQKTSIELRLVDKEMVLEDRLTAMENRMDKIVENVAAQVYKMETEIHSLKSVNNELKESVKKDAQRISDLEKRKLETLTNIGKLTDKIHVLENKITSVVLAINKIT